MGIYRAEFGGGYTKRRKIIVDAADMSPFGGEGYEIMALYENELQFRLRVLIRMAVRRRD